MYKLPYKYIFLDVGNVLFHDLAVEMNFNYFIYERLNCQAQHLFFETREAEMKRGNINWIYDYCKKNSSSNYEEIEACAWGKVLENWIDINIPIDYSIEALKKLHRLIPVSIAANQPVETEKLLKRYGITELVETVILDSNLGVGKPQHDFFAKMLEITEQNAKDCLYVGDRVDNDIIPTLKFGITPVWITYQPQKLHSPFVPSWWENTFFESYMKVRCDFQKCEMATSLNLKIYKFRSLIEFANNV